MITWHARVYKLRNTALPPLTGPIGVSPEHAGALSGGHGRWRVRRCEMADHLDGFRDLPMTDWSGSRVARRRPVLESPRGERLSDKQDPVAGGNVNRARRGAGRT